MEFLRLFTAIMPSEHAIAHLRKVQQDLEALVGERPVRWVRPANMHITLHFLGDTPVERVDAVKEAMERAGTTWRAETDVPAIPLRAAAVRVFPGLRRPRVVVAEIDDQDRHLSVLQGNLGRELNERGFGIETRPFRPHVTLGYVRKRTNPGDLDSLRRTLGGEEAPPGATVQFTAERILLVKSTLAPGGSVYDEIYCVSLTSASSATSSGERARE